MAKRDMLDMLTEYSRADYIPMHMPGAKRNSRLFDMGNPFALDITEIEGFDNMHNPQGIIKDAQERCANVFGAEESLFLINGSSAGILAAICGTTKKGDCVIVARNSHTSVYNALYMNELHPVYVYPKVNSYGFAEGIKPQQILDAFEECGNRSELVKAVVITSPTYEGMISNIQEIAKIVHDNGAVLIVDEAHGAHLNFSDAFPVSAVSCGADVVIQSVHKTLPSLTQTAVMHMNGSLVDRERVRMYWNIYQTTSPSYILMAGLDRCVSILERDGEKLFAGYISRLKVLRERLKTLKNIKLCDVDDISKIVLATRDGKKLYDKLLKDFHIQCEMASAGYVVAMTSIGDTDEYYERFYEALKNIDDTYAEINLACADQCQNIYVDACQEKCPGQFQDEQQEKCVDTYVSYTYRKHKQFCSIYDAVNGEKEYVALAQAVGRVAAEKICLYPPGIPLVVQGEFITKEDVQVIEEAIKSGIEVIGIEVAETEVIGIREEKVLCLR